MAHEKMKIYCETSFWSWLVSRPSTEDAVMDEVYANRREISMRFGNDPKRYIACIRDMKRRAKEAGVSFLKYCKSFAGADAMQPLT